MTTQQPAFDHRNPVVTLPALHSERATVLLFGATTFTASALLFLVQPMSAKMVLPRLGGSPAVWNTCVLFFQTALFLGYVYAHLSTRWLGVRRQSLLHLLPMLAALALLPLALGQGDPAPEGSPVLWLLRELTVRLGLPFLVVSTMAPVVQTWFAALATPRASDPYFLYAASNAGSFLALLAYPLLLEPFYGTRVQSGLWMAGYGLLLILAVVCVVSVRRSGGPAMPVDRGAGTVSGRQRLRWIALACIPSSLLLGVTTHVSADLASVPLLWVVPLGIYLVTFVLAFATREWVPRQLIARALPILLVAATLSIFLQRHALWIIPLHLLTFFVAAMACHTGLARSRPPAYRLTEFYVWISVGGMVGGIFNTLIAPHIFNGIFEYPIMLALAGFCRDSPGYRRGRLESLKGLTTLAIAPVLVCSLLWAVRLTPHGISLSLVLGVSASVAGLLLAGANRRMPFNILLALSAAILVLSASTRIGHDRVLYAARSFFGVARVTESSDGSHHVLLHGTTIHGWQNLPADSSCEPQSYYSAAGPIGQLFRVSGQHLTAVAVVGLGSGALACYAEPKSRWTFIEIDPLIDRIARDPRLFTFLQNSRGRIAVEIGDGRKKLQDASPGTYDLIVLDAFSSDAVPVHLITAEAVQMYLSRLRTGGAVAIHISNRYLNLEPVLADTANAAGLFALTSGAEHISAAEANRGRLGSHWVLLARHPDRWTALLDVDWRPLRRVPWVRQWTDDYSNLLSSVRFLQGRAPSGRITSAGER